MNWGHQFVTLTFRFDTHGRALPTDPQAFQAFQHNEAIEHGFWVIPEQEGPTLFCAHFQFTASDVDPPEYFAPWAKVRLADGLGTALGEVDGRALEFGLKMLVPPIKPQGILLTGTAPGYKRPLVVYAYKTKF